MCVSAISLLNPHFWYCFTSKHHSNWTKQQYWQIEAPTFICVCCNYVCKIIFFYPELTKMSDFILYRLLLVVTLTWKESTAMIHPKVHNYEFLWVWPIISLWYCPFKGPFFDPQPSLPIFKKLRFLHW